jgi:hypothetical protein
MSFDRVQKKKKNNKINKKQLQSTNIGHLYAAPAAARFPL